MGALNVEDKPAVPKDAVLKTGTLSPEHAKIYADIAENQTQQKDRYKLQLDNPEYIAKIRAIVERWGLEVDFNTGRIKYAQSFQPKKLNYRICYVRHGKTEGNTEPRIFQGYVDYWQNQLSAVGKKQAEEAAEKLLKLSSEGSSDDKYTPQLVVLSPLLRAIETANPYLAAKPEITAKVVPESCEMKFGSLDNVRVIDVSSDDPMHLFYLTQNAVVRPEKPHVVAEGFRGMAEGTVIEPESFLEVIDRMGHMLFDVDKMVSPLPGTVPAISGTVPNVLFFGHSMAGAAVMILRGKGKTDAEGYLGFDGSFIMPNATPTFI